MSIYPQTPYIISFPFENTEHYNIALDFANNADKHIIIGDGIETLHICNFCERNIVVAAVIFSQLKPAHYGYWNGAVTLYDLENAVLRRMAGGGFSKPTQYSEKACDILIHEKGSIKDASRWIMKQKRLNEKQNLLLYQWFQRNNLSMEELPKLEVEEILATTKLSTESKIRANLIEDNYEEAIRIINCELPEKNQKAYAKEILYLRVIVAELEPDAQDIMRFAQEKDILLSEIPADIKEFIKDAINHWNSDDNLSLKTWLKRQIPTIEQILEIKEKEGKHVTYDQLGGIDGVQCGKLFPCFSDPYFHTRDEELKINIYSQEYEKRRKNRVDSSPLSKLSRVVSEIVRTAIDEWRVSNNLPRIGQGWVSETMLFSLVKRRFSDAIQHYYSKWLGRQHLDIYIPSLRVGMEYQGLQHYQPIDIFGGELGYKKTISRDRLKKRKCKENDVILMEWKHDRPISEEELDGVLESYGIKI